ncbi:MAG TPA: transposase [Bryobacteraceae bacterium]|nr:transposase [Bryobacteraceae bacterium]
MPEGFYRRKLPHWQPEGAPLFITWRLQGSLTAHVAWDHSVRFGQQFARIDRQLDAAVAGPAWMKDSSVARTVVAALQFADTQLGLYELRAWVVMSNHVHMVVYPHAPLWRITKAVKGFTARQANQILGRTGQPFWQHESFDRWVRDRREMDRTVRYIESNPVSAGLVGSPAEWPWSSAWGADADPADRLDKTGVLSY